MKYCRNCHILYSDEAAACPRCGVAAPEKEAAPEPEAQPDPGSVRRDWLYLVIGIPLFIAFSYLIVYLIKTIG
ncbi:MAG: hypothetical protein J5586_05605 [Clostridia bacterium]|nr:hypothetical protein [Clostridia bacterium]